MQFSMSSEYAIHGLVYLSKSPSEGATLLGDIARSIRVPKEYMRKIFQQLTKKHLVTARRGAKGGYLLARPASGITLKDVVEAIEGSLPIYNCLRLHRHCGLAPSCPVTAAFDEAREKMAGALAATSIEDIARQISGNRREHPWLKVTA